MLIALNVNQRMECRVRAAGQHDFPSLVAFLWSDDHIFLCQWLRWTVDIYTETFIFEKKKNRTSLCINLYIQTLGKFIKIRRVVIVNSFLAVPSRLTTSVSRRIISRFRKAAQIMSTDSHMKNTTCY